MRLSIVIPTFNRAGMFARTLPALSNQQTEDFTYEVIFVSNGSTDATESILKQAVATSPDIFRYFRIEPTGGPSAPRNVGIRAAHGDIVVIIDDDVAPDPDFLLRHAEFHRRNPDRPCAAVGEVYVPPSLMDDPLSLLHTHYSYDRARQLETLTFFDFWTCNVSAKRAFLLENGMFDETILMMEDIELAYRLEKAGMRLHFLPSARGEHLHQTDAARFTERARALGSWLYRIMAYLPDAMVKRRFGLISTQFGWRWFARRSAKTAFILFLNNPFTRGFLRLLGARGPKRNSITDAYYKLMFSRAFLMGYYNARLRAGPLFSLLRARQE